VFLEETAARFRRAGYPQPRLEAELLAGHVLGCTRTELLSKDRDRVTLEEAHGVEQLVRRRLGGEPLQYLTGVQEFRSLRFRVDPRVLIPRPETEGVVEACLDLLRGPGRRIADVGTGSGCIAVSLAAELPGAEILGLDVSEEALEVAAANADRLVPRASIRWLQGDLLAPLEEVGAVDAIVSNPPYVPVGDLSGLAVEIRDHEPEVALVAGKTGLEIIRRLVEGAYSLLVPGGWLVMEVGLGQWEPVRRLIGADGRYREVSFRPDLQGIPRVIVCRRPATEGGRM
jgi:release factor glutamine methyltransferase